MCTDFFTLCFILAGYLLGSISFAVVVSKLLGLADPHTYGSGNPGATNVLRSGHKIAALLTLVGDAAKGWLAVFLVKNWGAACGVDLHSGWPEWVGLAAFLGHLAPVFHRFSGGKGVATALGVLLGLNWLLGLAVFVTWGLVAYFSRYSSLAAIVAAISAPIYYVFLFGLHVSVAIIVLMSLLLIVRHRHNIKRLLSKTEGRF